ncbi:AAA family ATPase [Couchioplanes caeruleus]|uniref:AAA family ATPase n=1 Tax=Couchioplanes caeruleus TaxID=56438 RepID=UPI0020C0967E|nr:AAA family ATPase [Couchioplanes caeruleus]UQU62510.1 AAA family ATPase [Couchioplanes caeruleus]
MLTSLIAIAINGATGDEPWPAPFQLIQDYPWPSVIILTLAGVAVAIPLLRLGSGDKEATGPGNGSGAVDQTVSGGSDNFNQVISGGSGNPNQVVSGGPATVTHYHGVVHQTIAQALPEAAGPVPDVPGLPEFVAGTLFDRCTLLDRLRSRMMQPDVVFVELVGPRGIGKTAIAAELLRTRPDNIAAGYLAVRGYPGVNAYSVIDKLAAAVRIEDDRQRLVERLNDGDSDLQMRLNDVLGELGNERVWLVIDDAQDLFVAESGAWRDEALGLLFEDLRTRRRQHRIKVLWASEAPLQLAGAVTEKVDQRLPPPDFAKLIGKLTIPDAPVPGVVAVERAARGHPRTAELVLGIRAVNPHSEEDPLDVAPDIRALTRTLLSSLNGPQERALRLLAVLDRPVRPALIAHLSGRSTGQVREVFDELVRCRLIRRLDDHYYLPAGEASRITDRTATAEVTALRRRAAELLEDAARDGSAARLADLDDAFHAVDLYLDAGEPGRAVRLMDKLDNKYLRHWGQTAALTPWLARVSKHLFDYREHVAYVKLAGRALAQQGRLAEAIDVIERGVRMSTKPEGQRVSSAHLAFLVQLAAYCFRAGQVMKAAEHYQTLLDNSPAGHKGVATAHLGLALCLTETAAFNQAEEHLEAAASGDPDLELPLLHLKALISFERDDGSGIARLERARSRAEQLDDRVMVARCDDLAAWLWLLRRDRSKAEEAATRAQEVAVRVNDPELWSLSHTTLAVLDLGRGAFGPALRAADLATRYPWGLSAAEALAVLGVASLRGGEPEEGTRRAFTAAAELACYQKVVSPGCYRPLEVEGLALAGLSLLRPELGEQAAFDAYLSAQQIMDVGGARFRRRELFAALTAGSPGDPLPRIKDLLG